MKIKTTKLLPSAAEIWVCLFFAVVLGLAGNGKVLFQQLGISSGASTLGDQTSGVLSQGLNKLDSYHITASVVTFAIWAIIGLFVLSIVQSLLRLRNAVSENRAVGSKSYIHPIGFEQTSYWRTLLVSSLGSFIAVLLCLAYLVVAVLFIIPVGLTYIRVLIVTFSFENCLYALLGLAVLFVGLILLDFFGRLLRFRHQLV